MREFPSRRLFSALAVQLLMSLRVFVCDSFVLPWTRAPTFASTNANVRTTIISISISNRKRNINSNSNSNSNSNNPTEATRRTRRLSASKLRDIDMYEMMVGGERYEMVPLPDSMIETTIIVRNLCEFVTDDQLSGLFAAVTTVSLVPSSVARKVNRDSLGYGFVTFMTVQEKEAAIIRFHGYELNGRAIKVEEIRDHTNNKRVSVPEQLINYACGEVKKTRDGRTNKLRRVEREEPKYERQRKSKHNQLKHSKRNTPSSLNTAITDLSVKEQREMARATKRGYVTLGSTGYRRGRKSSLLATAHRQWCDESNKPHIIFCKASGGRSFDNIIVDLSPLRPNAGDAAALGDTALLFGDDFLDRWKTEIFNAAKSACMELRMDYVEDNSITLSCRVAPNRYDKNDKDKNDKDKDKNDKKGEREEEPPNGDENDNAVVTFGSGMWASKPINDLPSLSVGVFEGNRANAKEMARELAELWDVPSDEVQIVATPTKVRDDNHRYDGRGGSGRKKTQYNQNGKGKQRKNSSKRKFRDEEELLW